MLKAVFSLFSSALLSKFLGLVREMVVAYYFGADINTDIYFLAANLAANVLYAVTTSFGIAFVPIYLQKKVEDEHKAKIFAGNIFTFYFCCSILISVLLILFSPFIARLLAPSYNQEQLQQLISYLRIIMTGIAFSLATGLFQNLLNAEKKFILGGLTGIIFSLSAILMILFLSPYFGILALVFSLPTAYLIQFLLLGSCSFRFMKLCRYPGWFGDAKHLCWFSLPLLLSNSAVELNQIIGRILATGIGEGIVSALSYSSLILVCITGIFGMSIVTVYYTAFSQTHDLKELRRLFVSGTMTITVVLFPIAILMAVQSKNIVLLLFGRGAFNEQAVANTGIGVQWYALCVISIVLRLFTDRIFLALKDSKMTMKIYLLESGSNILFAVILSYYWGCHGLFLALGLASILSYGVQMWMLHRKIGAFHFWEYKRAWFALAGAGIVFAGLVLFGKILFPGKYAFVMTACLAAAAYAYSYCRLDGLRLNMNTLSSFFKKRLQ